jgi:hypothetical protein
MIKVLSQGMLSIKKQLIIIYCICDDIVKNLKIYEQSYTRMTLAEVMVTSLAAAIFFCGNNELAKKFMLSNNYVSYMLSKS